MRTVDESVDSLIAQRATDDDRPLGEQIEDLRDRTTAALALNGRAPTPRNVFLAMRRMQERREYHGLAADPAPVRHGTFAAFCPAPEGR